MQLYERSGSCSYVHLYLSHLIFLLINVSVFVPIPWCFVTMTFSRAPNQKWWYGQQYCLVRVLSKSLFSTAPTILLRFVCMCVFPILYLWRIAVEFIGIYRIYKMFLYNGYFAILIFLIHEQGKSFHLLVPSSTYYFSSLYFHHESP